MLFNDGALPERWTVDTLFEPHKSVPYNPLIANVFYFAGFIESWGRGIEKMVRSCAEDGIPAPRFDVSSGDVKLTFTTIPERVMQLVRSTKDGINDTNQGHGSRNGGIENVLEKNREQYGAILTQMERDPNITIKELAAVVGISERQIGRRIRDLKNLSVIIRIGSDRGGSWKVM
jgi:ATP-dependent DNA helicase RecG